MPTAQVPALPVTSADGGAWVAIDLDGTLAEFDGWRDNGAIGAPVPAMVALARERLAAGYTVKVFTARMALANTADRDTQERLVRAWCREHVGQELEPTATKDFQMTELWDDLARPVQRNGGPDVEGAVRALLLVLGQDVTREGLRDTPRRVARMLRELITPEPFAFTTFAAEGMSEMVVQSPVPFHSLCEHHLLPFVGAAAVAYIPDGKLVGLSKLARAVRYCAAGLQNQERITTQVADMLGGNLQPRGVGVVLRARHLCMELRGVKASEVWTTTSCLRGALFDDARARAEFLRLADVR